MLAPLGPVRHVVAPNCIHDTYLEGWFAADPQARFVFDQHIVRGMPRLNEVAFLHRPSRTLIVTDLVFNLGPEMPFLSRVLLKLNDCDCKFAVSRLLKTTIKDRAAVRKSIDHILSWDFDRIVVSHGRNVESGGREMLREAFQFL